MIDLSLIAYIAWAAVIVLFLQTIVNLVLINTASTEPLALGLINSAFFVAWIVLSVGYPVAAAKSGVFADNRVCNTHYAEAYGSGCGNVRIAIAMLVMILLAAFVLKTRYASCLLTVTSLSTCWSIFFGVFRRYKDVRAGENVDDVSYANGNAPAGAAPVLQPTCDV